MNLEEYFDKKDIENAKKILIQFHDNLLLNKEVKNPMAILLSVYMISNKNKKSLIEKKEAKRLFQKMGRSSEDFDKAIYELSGKRKNKKAMVLLEKKNSEIKF